MLSMGRVVASNLAEFYVRVQFLVSVERTGKVVEEVSVFPCMLQIERQLTSITLGYGYVTTTVPDLA
jgi:hypothetical protein